MSRGSSISRRTFVRLSLLGSSAVVLAACQPTVIEKAVVQTVEVEKVVERPVVQTVEVEKVVEKKVVETVVVEKQVPAPKPTVTVRWYCHNLTQAEGPLMETLLAEFEEANPEIKIKPEPVTWADVSSKLIVQIQGGQAPDIWYGAKETHVPALTDMGAILPLTGLAQKFAVEDIWQQSPPALVEHSKYKGLDYLMPHTVSFDTLTYNWKVFEEVGLDPDKPPATWDELVEYGKKVTDPQKDRWGWGLMGARDSSCSRRVLWWCLNAGATLFSEDGKLCTLNSAEGVKGLTFWSDLERTHHIAPPGSVSVDFQSIMRAYALDKVVMWEGGANNPKMGEAEAPGTMEKTHLAAMPEPWKPVAGLTGAMVLAQTRYPDEAFRLASFFCSLETSVKWCTGYYSVPSRADVGAHPELKKERLIAEQAALASRCGPDPQVHAKWPEIREKFADAYAATLSGEKTPEEALGDFEDEANKILERWVSTGA